MDPEATLREIREIIERKDPDDFDTLVDLIDSLDGWLKSGGFLPIEWQRGRTHGARSRP